MVIDLSKQEALNADSKTMQQITFTGDLGHARNTTYFFHY